MIYRDPAGVNKRMVAKAVAIAIAVAIPAEGLRQVAYGDIADPKLLTVCYGSTIDVQRGKQYSLDECKARLDADMLAAVNAVERCAPGLPDHALAAFGDAVYNLGPTIVCDTKRSTAARLLKAGDWRAACDQLTKWDKANVMGQFVALPGLTKRRAAEAQLCIS